MWKSACVGVYQLLTSPTCFGLQGNHHQGATASA